MSPVYFLGSTITNTSGTAFSYPFVVAIAPNNQFAYVCEQAIYYIDVNTNTAIATVTPTSDSIMAPGGVAISPDNSFAYVACYGSQNVFKINTADNTAIPTTNNKTPFNRPLGIAISPDGAFALMADCDGGGAYPLVYYIDTASNTTTKTLNVTNESLLITNSIAISPDGKYAYVGGGGDYGHTAAIYKIDIDAWTFQQTDPGAFALNYPAAPGMRLYPLYIATKSLSGNNLKLANYLNENVPYTTRYPLIRLQGSSLSEGLMAAAPTRNTLSTFSAQLGQISLGRLVTDHTGQRRWERRPSSYGSNKVADLDDIAEEMSYTAYAEDELYLAYEDSDRSDQKLSDRPYQIWVAGFGQYDHVRPGMQTPSYEAGSGGIVAAVDYSGLYPHPLGAGVAYAHTHIHEKEDAGHASIDQGYAFVYGLFEKSRWYFDTALWGGYYHSHNVRHISFQYYEGGSATSKIHGWQLTPHLEVGYDWNKGILGLKPFTMLDYVATWEGKAKESGSTLYNFGQKARYCALLRSETGLRLQERLSYSFGSVTFMEKLSYAYQKAFHTGSITSFLVGAPGSFTMTTLSGAQNLGVAELEMIFRPRKDFVSTSLSFHTELGSRYQSYQGMVRLSREF